MKLTKDQTQKIALGALMMIGVVYSYFDFLLGPIQRGRDVANTNSDGLEPQIAAANGQIARVATIEGQSPEAMRIVKQVEAMIPEGSPVAWFPPRLSEFFKKKGIDKVTARVNNDSLDKDYVGYRRVNWGVELPRVDFMSFAAAIAELENEEMLLEIQSLDIEAGRDEAQMQRANLVLSNLVRQ
jgi:hypothetical protein